MKVKDEIIRRFVRIQRESMRDCALEYRRARARGNLEAAEMWLVFAKYRCDATRALLTESDVNPQLVSKVDGLIKQMAAQL